MVPKAGDNTISVFMAGTNESFAQEVVRDDIGKNTTIVVDLNKDGNKDIVTGLMMETIGRYSLEKATVFFSSQEC